MIENITSSSQFLYHYTKSSTAVDYILKSRTLRFSNYESTNDPKEAKNWQFDLGTNEDRDLGKYVGDDVSEWLSLALKQRTKLACFSMDSDDLTGNHLTDIHARGYSKPRMWAQYADNHTGVCLVFDTERLTKLVTSAFDTDFLVLSGPIEYINRPILRNLYDPDDQQYTINVDHLEKVGKNAYVGEHLATHYGRLFFEKMTDWRDEREWRYIVFTDSTKELLLDYRGSLVGIMFGENTAVKEMDTIMKLTESWGLEYMGLKWKNCSPWYDYASLRYIPGIKKLPWSRFISET